ncbi:MAG: hypothetical protein K2L27_04120 [Muribaculaceae bacterium]|nr:hypothetical protein [Muribaculaceae bacterium]
MRNAIVILYIIVAILGGWIGYACYCDLAFDSNSSAGIIVATLSVIVTLLVGWQIWQTINARQEIEQTRERLKEEYEGKISDILDKFKDFKIEVESKVSSIINKEIQEYDNNNQAMLELLWATNHMMLNQFSEAFNRLVVALEKSNDAENSKHTDQLLDWLEIYKSKAFNLEQLDQDAIKRLCEALKKIEGEKATSLIKYFSQFITTD